MKDSLSEKLNFCVNNYPVFLGTALDVPVLQSHGIEKVGFFARLILRPEKGEELYLSKNSIFSYLSGKDYMIMPVVDQNNKNKTLFGTIAYLWYRHDGLAKFGFQIVQNANFVAVTLFEDIEKRITEAIAPPSESLKNQKIWDLEAQRLILSLPLNNQYGYIHLIYREK